MERTLVLASTSPRRRTLLAELGLPFEVAKPALAEETLDEALPLAKALEKLAMEKAMSVAQERTEALILGADTIVVKDGVRLGKPRDEKEAREMLTMLSGTTHEVITAVALCCVETAWRQTGHSTSRVTFRTLSEAEIREYIATGEPFDKAGGYGIQGAAGAFVATLDGDYDNVVGLPLGLVRTLLSSCEKGV